MSFRFAIMGAARIAHKFCDAVRRILDCEVTAVASKSMEKARTFAADCQILNAYDSYEEMLQKERPDCVYVAVTPNFHYELTKLCMNYGVPVLCEKAMFMNSRDARDIFQDSREKNVFVMEALWSRFLPANRTAKQWLAEGKIGEVNCLTNAIGCAFDPVLDRRILDPALGGGAAFDLTVYNYQLATWFLGNEVQNTEVSVLWDESGIDAINHVCLKYERKVASLLSSVVSAMKEELVISGTGGKLVIPHAHYAEEAFLYDKDGNLLEHFTDQETENGFVYEICEVMKCIREGVIESRYVPHADTLGCAEVFDRIYEAK